MKNFNVWRDFGQTCYVSTFTVQLIRQLNNHENTRGVRRRTEICLCSKDPWNL